MEIVTTEKETGILINSHLHLEKTGTRTGERELSGNQDQKVTDHPDQRTDHQDSMVSGTIILMEIGDSSLRVIGASNQKITGDSNLKVEMTGTHNQSQYHMDTLTSGRKLTTKVTSPQT